MQTIAQFKQNVVAEQGDISFKRYVVGWILVVLNMLAALNSTFVFLTALNTGPVGWVMLNTCAPSIFLFVAGFLLGSPVVMVAASVMMFRYGTLGLFAFGWDGYNVPAQIGHILMTLAVIYVMVYIGRNKLWKTLMLGLGLGLAILIPFTLVQTAWFDAHPGILEKLFGGNLTPFE
jgi:hypothetical protein